MRLLIDGNILLDVLQKRKPHYEDSAKIWKMCEVELAEGYVSVLTFANVMRKELSSEKIEEAIKALSLIFRFEDLKAVDINAAAALQWTDFEDAIQSVTAERIDADYIITRNVKDFKNSKIIALTPSEFLARQ